MKKIGFILIWTVVLMTVYSCESKPVPVSIIFDTDMGPDYDDVGALTILHAMADSGEVRILATLSCNRHKYSVPSIDVINQYYGRPDLPVGAPLKGPNEGSGWTKTVCADFPHTWLATADAPDAVQVYRRILASEADTSVVVATVGFLTNLAALLQSPPDQYSPLDGKQLIIKKIKHLVSMAGKFKFPNAGREYNIMIDTIAADIVFEQWPTRIIFSGAELGVIRTGKRLINSTISNTPAKEVYTICGDNASWDQTAVLVAVRGADRYFNTVKGWAKFGTNGTNSWQNDPNGKHEYLTFKMPIEKLEIVIEDMMMHEPVK
jgi:hypothetical protein